MCACPSEVTVRSRIAAVAAAALLVSACSATTTGPPSDGAAMAHIHGLGINPADGALYAGTHYGVYRLVPGRQPERVSDAVGDFMGFTVVGPDHFLGSGHPSEHAAGQPANLGLIESTDGGRTWAPVALSGDADFHALEYRDGLVIGLDSATRTVMVSTDQRTWQRRAAVGAIDIAVSPANPNDILATTAQGVVRSTDQAATFAPAGTEPALAFLAWPDDGPLFGVDPAGVVYASPDSAPTWQRRRELGQPPQALLAPGDGVLYVATDTAIHRSTDNGTTFETYYALQQP